MEVEEEISRLRGRCISLEQNQKNPNLRQFWFPNYGTFKAFYDFLEEAARCKSKTNWRGQATVECRHYLEMYKSKPAWANS